MRKIISIFLVMLAVFAFSGVASATWVTDTGKSVQYTGKDVRTITNWNLLHYNSNHINFRSNNNYQLKYSGKWYSFGKVKMNVDMKKTTKNMATIVISSYSYNAKGKLLFHNSKKTTYTTKSSINSVFKLLKPTLIKIAKK